MKIYKPSVKLIIPTNNVEHVANCARVCYDSKTTNHDKLYNALKESKHLSMFRHETHYFIVYRETYIAYRLAEWYWNIIEVEDKEKVCGIDVKYDYNTSKPDPFYIVMNGQYVIEHPKTYKMLSKCEVSREEFAKTTIGFNMLRYTFECITQISTSREFNRVSPNNIAESSTRYIYEDGSIVAPHWLNEYIDYKYNSIVYNNQIVQNYVNSCTDAFYNYKYLIKIGMHKQDARGVLPLDTKTKVIYTYSIDEWYSIIRNRYYGDTGTPHGNAKILAGLIKEELEKLGYSFNKR